ncbi:MAG: reverse transcriptase-like protein, partial [Lachnospiraceae bacterium]|nr:reverse transcriptase-like protein [Lachnospiraceae bacterium]
DGSYNASTGVYGYGGFVVTGNARHEVKGSGNDAEMASMRNVAGEIEGAMAAVRLAMTLGISKLVIYYDYKGIEMWATGEWKRNKKGTIAYYEFMQAVKKKITLEFVKVKGHSGVLGNEEADRLAKEAVGLL